MNEAIDAIRDREFWKEEKFKNLKEYIEKYWFDIKEVNRYRYSSSQMENRVKE